MVRCIKNLILNLNISKECTLANYQIEKPLYFHPHGYSYGLQPSTAWPRMNPRWGKKPDLFMHFCFSGISPPTLPESCPAGALAEGQRARPAPRGTKKVWQNEEDYTTVRNSRICSYSPFVMWCWCEET